VSVGTQTSVEVQQTGWFCRQGRLQIAKEHDHLQDGYIHARLTSKAVVHWRKSALGSQVSRPIKPTTLFSPGIATVMSVSLR